VVLPPMIARIEDAQTTNEDAKLEEIARALVKGIITSGKIPNPNLTPFSSGGWGEIARQHTILADDSAGPRALHYVYPAEDDEIREQSARRVYVDNTLMAYLASLQGSANVPFTTPAGGWPEQSAAGVNFPNQAMPMFIVSSSKKGLALECGPNQPGVMMNPAPQDAPGFGAGLIADLKSWVKAAQTSGPNAGSIMVPQSIARWGQNDGTMYRRGEFLHVKVVDLRPLFCRVTLREFPYPQSGTTQTVNAGAGYTAGTAYPANIGSFSFSFIAPAADFNNPATGLGTVASSIALSGTRSQITRSTATTTAMTGSIGGGTTAARFDITINNPPWWDISPPTAVAGQQMPNNSNTQFFYVIKGTSLSLYADAAVLPAFPVLTVQVNSDSTFEYFNGSWTRVD